MTNWIAFLITLLLIVQVPLFADVSEEQTINDEDKTSSRINNMFEDIETIEKAANAAKTGTKVYKEAKKVKNLKDVKDVSVSSLKDKAKGLVFKYKNAKAGFLYQLYNFANKTSQTLDGMNKKLNQWNTTLPTIKAYGKAMRNMLDNTVEVFHEFEWDAFYDIDRKWDKKLEGQLTADYRTFQRFSRYLENRYYSANKEKSSLIAAYFGGLFDFDNEIALDTDAYMITALSSANEHRMVPYYTLYNCSEALSLTSQMIEDIHGLNDNGVPKEQQKSADMVRVLQNGKRTMEDERQLQAMIERARHEANVQSAQLEQLLASLQEKYARLYLLKTETKALESESYYSSLEKMMECTVGDAKSIDEYRKKLVD
jgi:hypothetical protein